MFYFFRGSRQACICMCVCVCVNKEIKKSLFGNITTSTCKDKVESIACWCTIFTVKYHYFWFSSKVNKGLRSSNFTQTICLRTTPKNKQKYSEVWKFSIKCCPPKPMHFKKCWPVHPAKFSSISVYPSSKTRKTTGKLAFSVILLFSIMHSDLCQLITWHVVSYGYYGNMTGVLHSLFFSSCQSHNVTIISN